MTPGARVLWVRSARDWLRWSFPITPPHFMLSPLTRATISPLRQRW